MRFKTTTPPGSVVVCLMMLLWPVLSYADITTGLVGWWKMDESSGALIDAGSGGNNLTLQNGPSRVSGRTGGGISFTGSSHQYASIANPSATVRNITNVTLAAWIKSTDNSKNQNIIERDADVFTLQLTSAGVLTFVMRDAGFGYFSTSGTGSVPRDIWTHVAVAYNGTNAVFYINGSGESIAFNHGNMSNATLYNFLDIGQNVYCNHGGNPAFCDAGGYYDWFNGSIDDVRVYNRALSSSDMTELYNSSRTVSLKNASLRNFGVRQ